MNKELLPHQQRVVDEAEELFGKLTKLNTFLDSGKAAELELAELSLLRLQRIYMKNYLDVLNARIRIWKK